MPRITWDVSECRRKVTRHDYDTVRTHNYRFKPSKQAARVCSECAFAVEKTICDLVNCDGGYFVERDQTPTSRSNPHKVAGGSGFAAHRKHLLKQQGSNP